VRARREIDSCQRKTCALCPTHVDMSMPLVSGAGAGASSVKATHLHGTCSSSKLNGSIAVSSVTSSNSFDVSLEAIIRLNGDRRRRATNRKKHTHTPSNRTRVKVTCRWTAMCSRRVPCFLLDASANLSSRDAAVSRLGRTGVAHDGEH
jgi:hypothetical protein